MGTDNDVEIFRKYKNDCSLFIETGSYIGDGIQAALDAGFKKVISIEISDYYYKYCKNRFLINDNVSIVFGDSTNLLDTVLSENINDHKSILFWLDAHNSGGLTGGGGVTNTVVKELNVILNYVKQHNISAQLCIDDVNDDVLLEIDKLLPEKQLKFVQKELCINSQTNMLSQNYIAIYSAGQYDE